MTALISLIFTKKSEKKVELFFMKFKFTFFPGKKSTFFHDFFLTARSL